jgi:hypothetical protein
MEKRGSQCVYKQKFMKFMDIIIISDKVSFLFSTKEAHKSIEIVIGFTTGFSQRFSKRFGDEIS